MNDDNYNQRQEVYVPSTRTAFSDKNVIQQRKSYAILEFVKPIMLADFPYKAPRSQRIKVNQVSFVGLRKDNWLLGLEYL